MFRKHARIITSLSSWGLLGFYRGLKSYDYHHEKSKTRTYIKPEPYLYSAKFFNGILGCLFYLNPVLIIVTVPKEIYRIEVNLRGLESEKKSDRYNEFS